MKRFIENVRRLVVETSRELQKDHVPTLAASLSFFAVFSIVPVVLLLITVAGTLVGVDETRDQLMSQLHMWVGPTGASFIESALEQRSSSASGNQWASIISIVLVIVGSTRFFAELQYALNTVWDVEPKDRLPILEILRKRVLSAILMACLAGFLAVSIAASAAASAFAEFALPVQPGEIVSWEVINFGVSFLLAAVLLTALFKLFPDAKIRLRDTWPGATLTAAALVIGKFLFGYYVGKSAFASTYGAAGSIIVFLVFVYAAATIVLVGAEFTQVWARTHGQKIEPEGHARRIRRTFVGRRSKVRAEEEE